MTPDYPALSKRVMVFPKLRMLGTGSSLINCAATALAVTLLGAAVTVPVLAAPTEEFLSRCETLTRSDLSVIADAPTQITDARFLETTDGTPARCVATGYVAPNIGIKMGLPTPWNGKFLEMGCAGYCGVALTDEWLMYLCGQSLRRGYACIVSDLGHRGGLTETIWALDNFQAKLDFGYRATHVIALAGKALAERYYGRPARTSYFIGGSNGGRQALQAAQRFPWDFNGIAAIEPPTNESEIFMTFAWGYRVLHDEAGNPLLGKEELQRLTDAAVDHCDMDDGVRDGVISDPLYCAFDPGQVACSVSRVKGCLNPRQLEAVRKVYAGPLNSKGEKLTVGGPVVGSEFGLWDKNPQLGWKGAYLGGLEGVFSGYPEFAVEGLRHLLFSHDLAATWKLNDFDFDRDSHRMTSMEVLLDSGNPDLRRFKAAGGKLLIFQAWNDVAVLPRTTIDYYETVERTMGGRKATEDFARLFVLPGIGHDPSAGAGAGLVDYLSALEAWVEKSKTPDRLIAMRLKDGDPGQAYDPPDLAQIDRARIKFTRPLYPYPKRAKYSGRGDPNDAANFTIANP